MFVNFSDHASLMYSQATKQNKVKGPGVDKEVTASSIRAGIYKMLVRIANSEDPDQTASSEAV